VSEIAFPSTVALTTFEFHGTSFKTRTEAMVYRYRLQGFDQGWHNTHNTRVEYDHLPVGDYTFQVQAVDRDHVYSEVPATVALTVHLPYERIGLVSALVLAIGLVGWQTSRVIRRDRRLQEANAAMSDANKELFQANRKIQLQTERKSAFLASMSHELRTPMNAIKGFTSLVLRREKDLSDRNRENLEKVTQASDHLLAMINDILDLSKIEEGQMDVNPEPFDMKALVTYCCATVSPLLEEKSNVKLEQDVADGIEQANTDQGRIRQMLINLLSNAIKFTDSGSVTVKAKQEEGQLELCVSDTGKGIPQDELLTIFDEYRQVKGSDREHKGTGLGLSITKQFAELLGGSVGVESQVGKGSTFTVRVPVVYKEK
jgi:signal transduction histidine kinase